jgi:tetratricopeptide (TPR) repeat protein
VEERRITDALSWWEAMNIVLPRQNLAWEHLPEGVEVEGESCALAIALALLLPRLGHVPAQPIIVSARSFLQDGQAWLGGVAEGERKRRITALEAPGVPLFLVEGEGEPALVPLQRLLPRDWRQRLSPASAYALASDAWRAYQDRRYAEAARLAELAIHEAPEERALARAWWVRGACALHNARTDAAVADLHQGRMLLQKPIPEEDSPSAWEEEELLAYLLIAVLDLGRPDWLRVELEEALARLNGAAHRDFRWREVALQVAGSLHRVELLAGLLDQAEVLLRQISLKTACLRHEKARSLGDLAEVLRRKGDVDEARRCIRQARSALPDAREGQRAATARFLSLYALRCGEDFLEEDEELSAKVAPDWRDWPQPAEVLERLLRRPSAELGAWLQEHILGKGLDVIHLLVVLSAAARHPQPPPELCLVGAELEKQSVEPGIGGLARQAAEGDFSEWRRCGPY